MRETTDQTAEAIPWAGVCEHKETGRQYPFLFNGSRTIKITIGTNIGVFNQCDIVDFRRYWRIVTPDGEE